MMVWVIPIENQDNITTRLIMADSSCSYINSK